MPMWSQHFLVLLAVGGCIAFIARGVWRSLQGRKSSLNACGACGGCGADAQAAKQTTERVVFLPAEMLVKRR